MDRNPGDLSNKETNEIDFLGGDDLDGEEEFEFTDCGGQNKEDDEFDELVGALQDIVMDPEFEDQQREFLERNCMIFEDEEENKMEYMSIFKEYQAKIEGEIERRLQELKPELNMKKVFSLIEERIDEIDPQLLDMLLTFSDFQPFKEHMLAHKKLQLSIKKKSKKFEEFKQDKGYELNALEQDLSDLVISGHSGQSKQVSSEKEKKKEVKPAVTTTKKEEVVNKENKGKVAAKEKELNAEDLGKFTHKKGGNKASADYNKPQQKYIFS